MLVRVLEVVNHRQRRIDYKSSIDCYICVPGLDRELPCV